MDFKNKSVVVTGANRGIGQALVTALLARGVAKVYACARDINSLDKSSDARVFPVALDITNAEQVKKAAQEISDVDILINNAGVATFGSVLELNRDDLNYDLEVNYFGTLNMAKAFAPIIEKKGSGAIVNNITIGAFASIPAIGGYCASKAAAYSLTQGLRIELGKKNITVHGIYPGPIDTDMAKEFPGEKTSALDCANAILDGLENNEVNIFPDAVSQNLHQLWRQNYLELETAFANFG